MIQYGKCLTTVYKAKRELAPIFAEIFTNKNLSHFDFSELIRLNFNSWDFFIESLDFLRKFVKEVHYRKDNVLFIQSAKPFVTLLREKVKDFNTLTDKGFLESMILFATQIKRKNVQHFYIENEKLFEFLTSVEIKSQKYMLDYLKTLDTDSVTFAFHFPNNSGCTINLTWKDDEIFPRLENEKGFFHIIQNTKILDFINQTAALKLCFNAISYTDCFSDNVRDGVPQDLKDKPSKAEIEKSKSLSFAKELEEVSAITAHFRHSHFRFCKSDFYKAKKNKWIFVHGSMVGDTAKTVLDED